jgi:hypothetical protein
VTTEYEDTAVAALAEVLVMADTESVWRLAVISAFPAATNADALARWLRWAPVPVKRRAGAVLVDLVLARSRSEFLTLAGAAVTAARPFTHPVWAELAARGR